MKKILSLLVLLVTTLSAFALDFTDYRKVTLGSNTPTESNDAKLSVTDNGDGTYNVTFNDIINKDGSYTDEYGTFTFSNVSGSTSGDVTTVTGTNLTGTVSGGTYGITSFTDGELSLKFKDGKAYATMTATCKVYYRNYTFNVVFGTDEGFGGGSTGGGETGGEDKPAIVDVVEADYAPNGASFGFPFTINWETQKLVAKLDLSTCSRYTHNEGIISVGTNNGNGDVSLWEPKSGEANCHLYYTHYYYGSDAKLLNLNYLENPSGTVKRVDNSLQNLEPGLVVFTFDKDGLHVGDNLIATPDQMTTLYNSTSLIFGSKEGSTRSNATYKYVKVVPLDWTEVPPVTVAETFTYDQDAFVGPNDTKGTANVKVYKMTDDSYTMEITAPVATKVGEISVSEDTKGRTTYMGEVESSVVSGLKYVVHGVVYEEDGAKHLYMTLTHDDDIYIIGENPDAPKVVSTLPFENVAYTTSMGGNGTATVTFTEMSDGTFPMTFVSDDLNVKAENLTKGTDEKGRTTYTGTAKRTDVDVTFTVKAVVYGETTAQKLYMTMDNGSSFVVTVGEDPDYVAPVTYKNTLKVVRGTDTKAYENAEVSVLAKGENKYDVTLPAFTDMDANEGTIGKLTFEATGVEDGGTLKLTATSATTTQDGGNGWGTATFTASMDATVTGDALTGTFTVVYPNDATNYTYTLYYGVEPPTTPEEPKDETVVEKYQADGTGFSHTINVDWDKQKIVASIDFSNGGDDKDILAMTTGDSFTAFQTSTYRTMHWYCNQTDKQISGFFAKSGDGNNNTGRIDVTDYLAKFEISKAEGLKVNGVVKMTPTALAELLTGDPIIIGSGESPKFSKAFYNYIKVVSLDWKEPTEPTEPEVNVQKEFNEALYMGGNKAADAKVVVKEMSDNTINMSLQFNGFEYKSTELTKGADAKNRTTYTGKLSNGEQTYDVAGVVYEKDNVARLYMTLATSVTTVVVGENPDVVTPEVTEVSNKTYTSNLRILDGETTVVEEAEANVNIIKYSDESYKVTLKNVNMLNKTQDLVFVGKALIEEAPTEATEPLTIIAKSDAATTEFFGEEMSATFEITEVSADEIKMGFSMESANFSYQGEFNYTEEETPEVYTNNLHIYDAAAPETDLFQADQAKVEFLATETGEFKLTLKDVTLNEKTQDLVFTGMLSAPEPGGQEPLAEEGETTPAEPAMVLNATADEATATFLGTTSATAMFNVIMNDEAETENDAFALTFTITAGEKTLGGEFNYKKKTPDTPDPELFCKENYVADGTGFEWDINVDWDTQKIVMSIDPSTCTGTCEDVIGLGAAPTAWNSTLHLYRTSADQQLQGYFQTSAGNNNTGKFDETAPFLVEVSKAQGFVVNNEVKIAASAMSDLFTLSTVKMGTGEGANDKSRATYNYVKVVDKDWTAPKDPDTGINATTVAEGEVEFFTVNGVKLNKLQKGLNIVRTADGKVKKVLVK
ncbi:calycin-like domain-containing protein [Leyella stercorea]|uniref:calycin-like domain-containing protein n=1 Tax=Leyella stercorea TaxID=363265 RepID=UPI00242E5448|nr:calycin-like domain-containing protein [Leyella stercorea]